LVELHYKDWGYMRSSALSKGDRPRPGSWPPRTFTPWSRGCFLVHDKGSIRGSCRSANLSRQRSVAWALHRTSVVLWKPVCGKDYIKDVQSSTPSDLDTGEDGWQEIPACGIVAWWFGRIGDRIVVYSK